ncbi:PBP1A family penicillin-binding protein [Merismopedia glauca]|uniref:Penicillin-binding protein n=1 Tax=Merismopedia glauca CCAP 1448/3 TaxID=1296344 RepID=A0A2T1C933_9CYAN|nr:PBP1A family penicillin-binding protein [Merismopedia glauca]PSB04785.1 penicillin-binding protein [Merismopedia glauca CCAP 1448/3]
MTNPQPPNSSKTILGQITQAVHTIQAKANFSQLVLKPNARVPELRIQETDTPQPQVYPLLGDKYVVGRSSRSCDIVVRNPVVSQIHFSVQREGKRAFTIKDENSTNGIYIGRRRISSLPLRHGDNFTLGPPELAAAVKVKYHNPPSWYKKLFGYTLYGIGGVTALIAGAIAIASAPVSVKPLKDATGPVVIYSRDLEAPLRQPRNQAHVDMTSLKEFSPYLPQSLMASEDARFNWHFGVDPIGTLRAILINTRKGEVRQGGSTLTQQVARSLFRDYVGTEDSIDRKVKEAIVAIKLESFYSKDDILLTYLNRVYLGEEIFGFEDAARQYFGKSAKDLTFSESATLVGILPAPNAFNPCASPEKALERRNLVIERTLGLGWVTTEEARQARRSRIDVKAGACDAIKRTQAPYFYSYVFAEMEQILGEELAKEGNFIVETGLDLNWQKQAEQNLRNSISTNGKNFRYSEGALVTLDANTGEIRAMVGGTNFQKSQFNRATKAKRQPGSTFKLFTYTSAIERGISPGKSYSCAPLTWQGQAYKGCERANTPAVTMADGLALSENAVALRVAQDVGLDRVVEMAQRLGVQSPLKSVPGLVLGQSEVNVLEITGAYGAVANRGVWNRPHAIRRIYDSSQCRDRSKPQTCVVVYAADKDETVPKRVLNADTAVTMTTMLQGVVQRGTGRGAAIGLGEEAGKTGTTNRGVDLWFVGFVPSERLVTGIWLGNDDNSPTRGSSAQSARLWGDYMRQILR